MLRRFCSSLNRFNNSRRFLSSTGDGEDKNDGNGKKPQSVKQVLGEDILKAVGDVVDDLHEKGTVENKKAKSTLINRLVSHEKATFDAASASASSEMLDDSSLLGLLSDIAQDGQKTVKKVAPRGAQARQERRGLVLLRKEIFYQAIQSGYKSEEARQMSEKVVDEAQNRLRERRNAVLKENKEILEKEAVDEQAKDERERKLFELATQTIEKIYQDDLTTGTSRPVVNVDENAPKLLGGQKKLGIFKTLEGTSDNSLGFWTEWDRRAALLTNKSFGPTNSFEEQIQWTEQGKQWPYPIDNEYLMGEEENVSFIDHIFLERHLPALGIPKTGPIAHFMHLVCVGLSKNPYMTAKKKREHLEWFANYFNAEKQKVVEKLHEQEQIAAQNAQ